MNCRIFSNFLYLLVARCSPSPGIVNCALGEKTALQYTVENAALQYTVSLGIWSQVT